MGDAGESELTAKARALIAGLSDDTVAALHGSALGRVGPTFQAWSDANDLDLVTCDEFCNVSQTDLGREVARLLSEVQS